MLNELADWTNFYWFTKSDLVRAGLLPWALKKANALNSRIVSILLTLDAALIDFDEEQREADKS